MSATIDGRAEELLKAKNFCHVATLRADGTIHGVPVWVDIQDGQPVLNTAEGRAWPRNLERDPRVTLTVQNLENPYQYLEIRGRAAEPITRAPTSTSTLWQRSTWASTSTRCVSPAKRASSSASSPSTCTSPADPHAARPPASAAPQQPSPQRRPARLRAQPLVLQHQLPARAGRQHALAYAHGGAYGCLLRAQSAYARSEQATNDHKSDSDTSPACGWRPGAPSTTGRVEGWASLHSRAARSHRRSNHRQSVSAWSSPGPGRSAAARASDSAIAGWGSRPASRSPTRCRAWRWAGATSRWSCSTADGRSAQRQGVHETRKALKRLRALLRLLEHRLGEQDYARENEALRDDRRRACPAPATRR